MSRILIVEDEPIIAFDLHQIIKSLGHVVVGVVDNGYEALGILSDKQIDLALLDIHIQGSIDGIDLGMKIREKYSCCIIYVTSFFDLPTMQRVQGVHPEAYIVKPFLEQQVISNVALALNKGKIQVKTSSKILVRQGAGLVPLDTSEILYVEGSGNYSTIHLSNGNNHTITQTLLHFGKKLDEKCFLRIHKSYLVSIDHIKSIAHSKVYLTNNVSLPIGKRYVRELWEQLQKI